MTSGRAISTALAADGSVGMASSVSRLQLSSLLAAQGSHPVAVAASLERIGGPAIPRPPHWRISAASIGESAKDVRLLELVGQSHGHKLLIFVNFRRTLAHVGGLLRSKGLAFSRVFRRADSSTKKTKQSLSFRDRVPIMLCTESGGEGRNLQFADTLINYDLPWNPMKIEQRDRSCASLWPDARGVRFQPLHRGLARSPHSAAC